LRGWRIGDGYSKTPQFLNSTARIRANEGGVAPISQNRGTEFVYVVAELDANKVKTGRRHLTG